MVVLDFGPDAMLFEFVGSLLRFSPVTQNERSRIDEYPKRRLLTQEKLAQVRARICESRFFERLHNREGKQIYKAHSSDFFEN